MHHTSRRSMIGALILAILFPLLAAQPAHATGSGHRLLGAIWQFPDFNLGHPGALSQSIVVIDQGDCDSAGYLTRIDRTNLDDLHLSMKWNTRSISNYRGSPNCNFIKVYKPGFWFWSSPVECYRGWLNARDTGRNCNGAAYAIRWQHGNG